MTPDPKVQDALAQKARRLIPHIRQILQEIDKEIPGISGTQRKQLLKWLLVAANSEGKKSLNEKFFDSTPLAVY